MAPISSELLVSGIYNLGLLEWSSGATSLADKTAQVASQTNILSDILAWFIGVFASIGSFLTLNWGETISHAGESLSSWWAGLSELLVQPHVRHVLLVWIIVFWICLFVPLLVGFGPAGVVGGSLAAWMQSVLYGAFTPAGGLFAILTSIGMMGIACPPAILAAATIASIAAGIVWAGAA